MGDQKPVQKWLEAAPPAGSSPGLRSRTAPVAVRYVRRGLAEGIHNGRIQSDGRGGIAVPGDVAERYVGGRLLRTCRGIGYPSGHPYGNRWVGSCQYHDAEVPRIDG